MKIKKVLIIIVISFFINYYGNSQQNNEKKIYRTYATQTVMRRTPIDTTVWKKRVTMEKEANDFKINGNYKNVRIPIVFHMLYDPTKQPIDENEIYQQIEVLNQDFGSQSRLPIVTKALTAEGFDKKISRLDLEFCIGVGKGQNKGVGINWIPVGSKKWTSSDSMKAKPTGGIEPWDTEEYLNVWVCNMQGDTAGYAQMPGGNLKTDGIVIDFRFFGTTKYPIQPYNKGKTLTHLLGSYLGLHELWNEKHRCADDGVADTPIHNAPNYGKAEIYKHISLCDGNPVEMNMNFMDNSDDESLFMFTEGQKYRIQSVLSSKGLRKGLSNGNSNCSKKIDTDNELEQRSLSNYNEIEINLFPNPTSSDATIKLVSKLPISGEVDVVIYDETGRIVSNTKFSESHSKEYPLDVKNMPNGRYFVSIKTAEFSGTEVLIVTR